MPNQPAKDKKFISILLKMETLRKIEKMAKRFGVSRSELITTLLERETRNVELTSKDYEEIAAEIRRKEAGSR